MGKNDKPHARVEIRCDAGIFERMELFREKFAIKNKSKLERTEFIEKAIEHYLNDYEYLVEGVEIPRK